MPYLWYHVWVCKSIALVSYRSQVYPRTLPIDKRTSHARFGEKESPFSMVQRLATLHKSEEFQSWEFEVGRQRQVDRDKTSQLDLALEPTPASFEDAQGSAI